MNSLSNIRLKRYIAVALILAIFLSPLSPAFASAKTDTTPPPKEIIYGILGAKGEVQRAFQVVVDSANENASSPQSTQEISQSTKEITQSTKEISQNTIELALENPQLPWTFETTYRLDGVETAPSGLAGKKGSLDFQLSVSRAQSRSTAVSKSAMNPKDYDSHVVQVVVSLPADCVKHLNAPGATVAYKGNTLQLVYFVLPSQGNAIGFSAAIQDFEMEPILISALPMSLDNTLDNTLEDTPSAKESRAQLDDLYAGTEALANGTAAFNSALRQVKGGADQLQTSGNQLNGGLEELVKGSTEVNNGSQRLYTSLKQLSEGLLAEQRANQSALTALLQSNQTAIAGLEAQIASLPKEAQGTPQATALSDTLALVMANQSALKAQLAGAQTLATQVGQLELGAQALSNGAGELNQGLKTAKTGYSGILLGISRLQQGLGTLLQKSAALKGGARDLNAELTPVKADLYRLLERLEALEPMLEADSSDRQYVLRTEGIYLPENNVVASPPAKPTLWEKVIALFGDVFR